jgi:hypothetical protein
LQPERISLAHHAIDQLVIRPEQVDLPAPELPTAHREANEPRREPIFHEVIVTRDRHHAAC